MIKFAFILKKMWIFILNMVVSYYHIWWNDGVLNIYKKYIERHIVNVNDIDDVGFKVIPKNWYTGKPINKFAKQFFED